MSGCLRGLIHNRLHHVTGYCKEHSVISESARAYHLVAHEPAGIEAAIMRRLDNRAQAVAVDRLTVLEGGLRAPGGCQTRWAVHRDVNRKSQVYIVGKVVNS